MPLGEIIYDFFEKLKSISRGYASFDYEITDEKKSHLVKLDIRISGEIVDALRREENHLYKFLLQELGTAGSVDKRRLVLQGRVPEKKINERIKSYIETFIVCQECNRPDTSFLRTGRTLNLHCEACGAKRPIRTNLIT